jgi:hypothetical protein
MPACGTPAKHVNVCYFSTVPSSFCVSTIYIFRPHILSPASSASHCHMPCQTSGPSATRNLNGILMSTACHQRHSDEHFGYASSFFRTQVYEEDKYLEMVRPGILQRCETAMIVCNVCITHVRKGVSSPHNNTRVADSTECSLCAFYWYFLSTLSILCYSVNSSFSS